MEHWVIRTITVGALCLGASWSVAAQVLEIGAEGVTVYSGPAVHTREGVVAIKIDRRSASTLLEPSPDLDKIALAAAIANISPELVQAVAWCESRMRDDAVSTAGAIGEMQLMPATAKWLGVNPTDSQQNYLGGALYLARMLRRYGGDLQLALAAYNAGPSAVDNYGGVPPFKETRRYVAAVLARLNVLVR